MVYIVLRWMFLGVNKILIEKRNGLREFDVNLYKLFLGGNWFFLFEWK